MVKFNKWSFLPSGIWTHATHSPMHQWKDTNVPKSVKYPGRAIYGTENEMSCFLNTSGLNTGGLNTGVLRDHYQMNRKGVIPSHGHYIMSVGTKNSFLNK